MAITGGGGTDVGINIRSTLDNTGFQQAERELKKLRTTTEKSSRATRSMNRAVDELGTSFKFEYLGTLFLGMAIRRTFETIEKQAIDTFRNITEATDGTVTNLTMMAASTEFLKYSVGDAINTALDPWVDTMLGVNEGIADFIDQNPDLVGGILFLGKSTGSILETMSQFALGFMSLRLVLYGKGAFEGTGIIGGIASVSSSIKALSALDIVKGSVLITGLLILTAIVLELEKASDAAMRKISRLLGTSPPGGTPGAPKEQIMRERFLQGDPMLTTPITAEQQQKWWRNFLAERNLTAPNIPQVPVSPVGPSFPANPAKGYIPGGGGGYNINIDTISVNASLPGDWNAIGNDIGTGILSSMTQTGGAE